MPLPIIALMLMGLTACTQASPVAGWWFHERWDTKPDKPEIANPDKGWDRD